jgi:undecaprenyl-diphosphatase
MNLLEGALLGLVQGLTEFLPVSSSGHLVLANHALGLDEPSLFTEVMLHAGTLVAIFMVFWRDLWSLGVGGIGGASAMLAGGGRAAWRRDPSFRLLVFLAIGTLPVAAVGLVAKDSIEVVNRHPVVVAILLVLNGVMLLAARRRPGETLDFSNLTLRAVLLVGLAQTLALLPGVSRSGVTIATALWVGVQRDPAGRLSFLLAVPAVLGATVLELMTVFQHGGARDGLGPVLVGTVVATVSGYVAIRVLLRLVREGRLFVFGPYCIGIGLAVLVLMLVW